MALSIAEIGRVLLPRLHNGVAPQQVEQQIQTAPTPINGDFISVPKAPDLENQTLYASRYGPVSMAVDAALHDIEEKGFSRKATIFYDGKYPIKF